MNRKAFLDTVAFSEGTFGKGFDGYNIIVGGELFSSYADHPRVKFFERHDEFIKNGKKDYSTAAGRYQILARNWDVYRVQLKLLDFSPSSQDAVAIQLIKECGALSDVDAGRFDIAVKKCKSRWASLPGAGYGQHENSIGKLRNFYIEHGGAIA